MPENGSNRRAFTEEELRTLFGAVEGEVRLLTTLGLYAAALRMSDIINLTWNNIDLKVGVRGFEAAEGPERIR